MGWEILIINKWAQSWTQNEREKRNESQLQGILIMCIQRQGELGKDSPYNNSSTWLLIYEAQTDLRELLSINGVKVSFPAGLHLH